MDSAGACGLDGLDGVRSLACGDVEALRAHLVELHHAIESEAAA